METTEGTPANEGMPTASKTPATIFIFKVEMSRNASIIMESKISANSRDPFNSIDTSSSRDDSKSIDSINSRDTLSSAGIQVKAKASATPGAYGT